VKGHTYINDVVFTEDKDIIDVNEINANFMDCTAGTVLCKTVDCQRRDLKSVIINNSEPLVHNNIASVEMHVTNEPTVNKILIYDATLGNDINLNGNNNFKNTLNGNSLNGNLSTLSNNMVPWFN